MDFWCCKHYIDFSSPIVEKRDGERHTHFRSSWLAVVGLGTFGNLRHYKVRELVESGEAAEAVLLLRCYYLLTSFLVLDNAESLL